MAKYKDQINLEIIRVYLSDAKKKAKGQYLIGSGNTGWSLSEAGLQFARRHAAAVEGLEAAEPRRNVGQDRVRKQRERARLMATEAYAKIATGRANEVTQRDAESFFRIDSYVQGEADAAVSQRSPTPTAMTRSSVRNREVGRDNQGEQRWQLSKH